MRVLIAEDERVSRASLVHQLQRWSHDVIAAEDGAQAWSAFQAEAFDVVITDWEMPQFSGIELLQHIRKHPRSAYCYVIMLTSRNDKADLVRGIEAGADDFIGKPFDREELRVRLLAGERIVRLERALSRQNAELREANERIRSGLRAAANVQRSMLPAGNIANPHVCTAWQYLPTDELAGDAIGLHLIDERYLAFYLLDVTGHGVPAALLSVSAMHSMSQITEETSALRGMGSGAAGLEAIKQPGHIALELNRRFRSEATDGLFFTIILCLLDTHTGVLSLTSAGHPPPLLVRGSETVSVPDWGGLPIAVADDASYDDGQIQLLPGDRICLFSDGILEQLDPSGAHEFGIARLRQSIVTARATPPQLLVSNVVHDLTAWAGAQAHFTDDVSFLVVDWLHGND